MLQMEHSAVLLTLIKLLIVIKICVLSIFEWQFYTGVTVLSIVEAANHIGHTIMALQVVQ